MVYNLCFITSGTLHKSTISTREKIGYKITLSHVSSLSLELLMLQIIDIRDLRVSLGTICIITGNCYRYAHIFISFFSYTKRRTHTCLFEHIFVIKVAFFLNKKLGK